MIQASFFPISMYPKVKVIQSEDPPETGSLRIYSKSLSLYDHDHPVRLEEKDGYTPAAHVRVHISTSASDDDKISVKAGSVNRRKVSEENKSNSSKVLPPRAVLSSPENDAIHGTKNKYRTKTQDKCQNTHVKCAKSYELEKSRRSWK